MERIIKVLIDLLVSKGMELTSIPAFIRNLANTLAEEPNLSLEELNRHIHHLGWDEFDLDLCTLQLVLATFDSDLTIRNTGRLRARSVPMEYYKIKEEKERTFTFQLDHSKVVHPVFALKQLPLLVLGIV